MISVIYVTYGDVYIYIFYAYTSIYTWTCTSEERQFIQKVISFLRMMSPPCLQVSKLSWIEKKMAATLFGKIPSSTVEEALQNFLKVYFVCYFSIKLAPTCTNPSYASPCIDL